MTTTIWLFLEIKEFLKCKLAMLGHTKQDIFTWKCIKSSAPFYSDANKFNIVFLLLTNANNTSEYVVKLGVLIQFSARDRLKKQSIVILDI